MFIIENIKRFAKEDRIVAVDNEGELSYCELDRCSESLAAYLLERYPQKNPIIIWGDKENEMLIAVLACLKSGRTYVMVPNYLPEKRVSQMTGNCHPDAVLLTGKKEYPLKDTPVLGPNDRKPIYEKYASAKVQKNQWIQPDDTVCIFYTSGSTGTPKGVMITRRNIEAFVDWWFHYSNLNIPNPRWLNFTPYAFSSSMGTIYNAIGALGATCYAIDKELSMDYSRLIDFIVETNPHYLDCTPSFADICLRDGRFNESVMTNLRQFSVGGEPLSHGTARQMMEHFPHVDLMNGYGSTETTIGPILCSITEEMIESDKPMPIGYCAFNAKCEVHDENGDIVETGKTGELVVISDMVTKGYYQNKEKTEENYYFNSKGEWCFNTHDLVWQEKNGLFYYVGRSNNLVKVGGYRVELEEVERYLGSLEGVEATAVAPAMQGPRTKGLVAYVVMENGQKTGISTTIHLKKQLSELIHPYMVPQKFIYLKELPKNANGKVDRLKLLELSRVESPEG